jgi:hypothetical protein
MTNHPRTLHFVDPKNDVAFKKIFGSDYHHETLIEFLNSVLKLPEKIESKCIDLGIIKAVILRINLCKELQ